VDKTWNKQVQIEGATNKKYIDGHTKLVSSSLKLIARKSGKRRQFFRLLTELKPYANNHTNILLRHHICAAQFWKMGRGTWFELGGEGIPLGGEPERERVDTEISARFWGDFLNLQHLKKNFLSYQRGYFVLSILIWGRLIHKKNYNYHELLSYLIPQWQYKDSQWSQIQHLVRIKFSSFWWGRKTLYVHAALDQIAINSRAFCTACTHSPHRALHYMRGGRVTWVDMCSRCIIMSRLEAPAARMLCVCERASAGRRRLITAPRWE